MSASGDLRVWWIPQLPMDAFYVPVKTVDEAIFVIRTLAEYDLFQFPKRVKPDYCNVGGLEVFEDGEWHEWESDDFDDINDYEARLASQGTDV